MLAVNSSREKGSTWRNIEQLIERELDEGCSVSSKPDPETGGVMLIFSSPHKTLSVLLSKHSSDRFRNMPADEAASLLTYLANDLSVCDDQANYSA